MPVRCVRDAKTDFEFNMTDKHIKNAVCKDPRKCAVSNSIMDTFPGAMAVETGTCVVKIITKKEIIRYKTPPSLSRAVMIFDYIKIWPLPAGDYTLTPLCPSQTQNGRKDRHKGTKKKKKKQVDTFRNRNTPTRRVTRPESLTGENL